MRPFLLLQDTSLTGISYSLPGTLEGQWIVECERHEDEMPMIFNYVYTTLTTTTQSTIIVATPDDPSDFGRHPLFAMLASNARFDSLRGRLSILYVPDYQSLCRKFGKLWRQSVCCLLFHRFYHIASTVIGHANRKSLRVAAALIEARTNTSILFSRPEIGVFSHGLRHLRLTKGIQPSGIRLLYQMTKERETREGRERLPLPAALLVPSQRGFLLCCGITDNAQPFFLGDN
ncbi:hypothetical protein GMRT_12291 [Giardia muris]|uniref:Uncharacterized protein n=1 Tax=Giardia muris TaxID=5742 RepID=A0A4Z1T8U8_GIAMU|nr:hypothetical protein GMRT_12291 [Giardia muris]|eukprot:TNJ30553.1 hypothetical protein GMRT_12291 [Giardia muris]